MGNRSLTKKNKLFKGQVFSTINGSYTIRYPHTRRIIIKNSHKIFKLLTKINSKYIIDLDVTHKIIKLLKDNVGENLTKLSCSN